jgi:predicted ATPase
MRQALESRQKTSPAFPLVGRRQELRELIAAFRGGRSRLLTGPIGIGKRRLVQEALESAGQPFVRVSGQVVLHELLVQLAGALNCLPASRKPTSAALRRLVLDALRRTPQCVVVEDLHDADPRMYRFLQQIYWFQNGPLIVTTTSRGDLGYVQRLLWDPREEIAVEPLSRAEAQSLLDQAVRYFAIESPAVEDFGRKVLAAAKGNPGQILAMCGMAALPQYQAGNYIKFLPLRMDMLSAFIP